LPFAHPTQVLYLIAPSYLAAMIYPRTHHIEAISDRILRVEFTNQHIKEYDTSPLLEKPMFAPLKQPAFFRNFKIESGGYAVVWNEDIDISEYELWQNGIVPAVNL